MWGVSLITGAACYRRCPHLYFLCQEVTLTPTIYANVFFIWTSSGFGALKWSRLLTGEDAKLSRRRCQSWFIQTDLLPGASFPSCRTLHDFPKTAVLGQRSVL